MHTLAIICMAAWAVTLISGFLAVLGMDSWEASDRVFAPLTYAGYFVAIITTILIVGGVFLDAIGVHFMISV